MSFCASLVSLQKKYVSYLKWVLFWKSLPIFPTFFRTSYYYFEQVVILMPTVQYTVTLCFVLFSQVECNKSRLELRMFNVLDKKKTLSKRKFHVWLVKRSFILKHNEKKIFS